MGLIKTVDCNPAFLDLMEAQTRDQIDGGFRLSNSPEDVMRMAREILLMVADGNLSEEQQQEISIMIDRIGELAVDSVSEGRADMGALLLTDEDDFRFVLGAFVADGNRLTAATHTSGRQVNAANINQPARQCPCKTCTGLGQILVKPQTGKFIVHRKTVDTWRQFSIRIFHKILPGRQVMNKF